MIHVCEKLLPHVLKIYCCDDWTTLGDIAKFEKILSNLVNTKQKTILLYSPPLVQCNQSNFPPLSSLLVIITRLMLIRSTIKEAILFNIIYLHDKESTANVEKVLQYYTPINPVRLVKTKEEAATLINESLIEPMFCKIK
jgi:hypothetical protein